MNGNPHTDGNASWRITNERDADVAISKVQSIRRAATLLIALVVSPDTSY